MTTLAQNFAALLIVRNKLSAFIKEEAMKVALAGENEITVDLSNFDNVDYVKHYLVDVLGFKLIYANEKFMIIELNEEFAQVRDFRLKLETEITNLAADAIDLGKNHVEFDVEDNNAIKVANTLLTQWGFKVASHEHHVKVEW